MDSDEYTTCPYNASHRIPKSRIQHHLIKCQKNHPKFLVCPFNATHRFPEHLMREHCNGCPNRRIDDEKYKKGGIKTIGALTAPTPILQKEYLPVMDPEDDYWDD